MVNKKYTNHFMAVAATAVLLLATACERRELYVYGDEFKSVTLDVDWRQYSSSDPDGMTVWFYPLDDPTHAAYRTTTANVRHQDLYLPGGRYQGVVIDYSPEEYSWQTFRDIDSVRLARAESVPLPYQPDSLTVSGQGVPVGLSETLNQQLYGETAWTALQTSRPDIYPDNGLYTVAAQPEEMGVDTLDNKSVDRGEYGDYIPYKERDSYQTKITIKHLEAQPESAIWKIRIRVWISSGFNYLWQSPSSLAGLADGHLLALNKNTDRSCLLSIDSWELSRVGENSGWISTTLSTFGLRPGSITGGQRHETRAPGDVEPAYNDNPDWNTYTSDLCLPGELRLNLAFVLRDHATALTYHFDVGHYVVSYDEQLVLRVDLGPDFFDPGVNPDAPDPIILPYVEAYNGAGFDADVTPWEDEPPVDITF